MRPIRLLHKHTTLVTLALLMIAIQASGDMTNSWLEYQRAGIMDGELWRLVTGHFIHINWSHLLLNLAGFVFIWILGYSGLDRMRQISGILLCSLAVSLALFVFNRNIDWYQGFSGVLHGLFVLAAGRHMVHHRYFSLLLLLSVAVKITLEQLPDYLPWDQSTTMGFQVVADAHLYGSIAGLVLAILFFRSYTNARPHDATS